MMAISSAIHIAALSNAKDLYNIINKLFPCEIWKISGNKVTKVL